MSYDDTGECSRCGQVKTGHFDYDPFIQEVWEQDDGYGFWCDDCYSERRDEV